ncbi:hypothetical protein HN709_03685 [Candidatus Peregrinibacteria bacterium]|jgi:hypothetical protein|nr:hypothetical protein [Candidatus Peregrinibacteria bacterium]MBT7736767.1 hypothetical protein [Candidatus Peregrinibacteria bacterium]
MGTIGSPHLKENEVTLPLQERSINLDGDYQDYTYIIPIPLEQIRDKLNLPEIVNLEEGAFNRKNEFHVTVLGFHTQELIRQKIAETKSPQQSVTEINKALSEIDFSFTLLPESLKLVRNLQYNPSAVRNRQGAEQYESEYTIAIDVDMPGMQEFYQKMGRLGIDLGAPCTHITLYIKGNGDATGFGIAMTDLAKQ